MLFCISMMLIGCASTTIETYKPKSPDEEAILNVLKFNKECIREKDLSGLMTTYHDNATIMIYQDSTSMPMVSKKQYAAWVPTSNAWGGDVGKLSGPKIIVSGNTATIKTTHSYIGHASLQTIVMVKENDKWSITSWIFHRYS